MAAPLIHSHSLKSDCHLYGQHESVADETGAIWPEHALDIRLHGKRWRYVAHIVRLDDRFMGHNRLVARALRLRKIARKLAPNSKQTDLITGTMWDQSEIQQTRICEILELIHLRRC